MKTSAANRKKINRIITIALICMIVLLVVALLVNLGGTMAARGQANRLESEIQRLENDNAQVEAELEYRQTDQFIRDYAKEHLGMGDDGDRVFIARR